MVLELLCLGASAMSLPSIEGDKLEGSSRIILFNGECRIIVASLNLKKVRYSYKKNTR
jgi:hypothetical protein